MSGSSTQGGEERNPSGLGEARREIQGSRVCVHGEGRSPYQIMWQALVVVSELPIHEVKCGHAARGAAAGCACGSLHFAPLPVVLTLDVSAFQNLSNLKGAHCDAKAGGGCQPKLRVAPMAALAGKRRRCDWRASTRTLACD